MKKCLLLLLSLLLFAAPAAAEDTPLVPALVPMQMPAQQGLEPVPLYCGPTQGFYRHDGQSLDPSEPYVLFGQEDCWALAAQGTVDSFGPVGYVEAAALGLGDDAPALAFEDALPAMIEEEAALTNDPLSSSPFAGWGAALARGEQVIVLSSLGSWLYVQAELDGVPLRVFVPTACIL